MAQYKVQGGQNIWDISMMLYGSIEGAFDLFMSNPWLTMTTVLKAGDILEYHDNIVINSSIVKAIQDDDMLLANGERKVYYKEAPEPLKIIAEVPSELNMVAFSVSGEHTMYIDWGDNSTLQVVKLTNQPIRLEHYFDNVVDTRKMKIYGNFTLRELDLSAFKGSMFPVTNITIDSFTSISNYGDLRGLFLCNGVVKVDLRYSQLDDLSPIYDYGKDHRDGYTGLQELNLLGVKFTNVDVLDDYLEYLADKNGHGTRRPCKVYLDTTPSERGMTAINTILNDPKWNQEGFASSWEFYINDVLYTTTEE